MFHLSSDVNFTTCKVMPFCYNGSPLIAKKQLTVYIGACMYSNHVNKSYIQCLPLKKTLLQ